MYKKVIFVKKTTLEKAVEKLHNLLTSSDLEVSVAKDLVLDFAKKLGWSPSYFIPSSAAERSNGYLVIEHGLENSAILSFLNVRNEELTTGEEEVLLSLSYNNLVNWHITIDERYINYYFILNKEKRKVETRKIEVGNEAQALGVDAFYEIINKKPNSNIKALDDVLIDNISNWKRLISAELNNNIDLTSLSHLFNSIIFLRSIEDGERRKNNLDTHTKILLDIFLDEDVRTFSHFITKAESTLREIPNFLVDKGRLAFFDILPITIIRRMINTFYYNEYNRFKYDFSIITKQALSRIYQKYVSLLYVQQSDNPNLFGYADIPQEMINKEGGAFYTPEYIARFFSKYITKRFTRSEFDTLTILDPAVGSGIFLRTILETEIEKRIEEQHPLNVDALFSNVFGIDVDPNACLATKLSLALLHHNFNEVIENPKIENDDALQLLKVLVECGINNMDVVISNPPYINQNKQKPEVLANLKQILGNLTNGKIDTYQAFLKLSIDILKPNGIGLFVLPHNFLISESSKKLRNYLIETCNIEVVADLSAINVFENVNTYTILLILRKKNDNYDNISNTWLLKCKTSVGEALSSLLEFNENSIHQYQIYKTSNYFKKDSEWFVLNREEFNLFEKINESRKISDFLDISQGIITGKDSIFIREKNEILRSERKLYKSFISDKKITPYSIVDDDKRLVFFPFINGELISEENLKNYENTWTYLNSNIAQLQERGKVSKGQLSWWKLHSSGNPVDVNSPKIITPYLSITPKFALDITGDYITSRSPYFTLKNSNHDPELLFYFLGILNSLPCYWALSLQSHKQGSGYNIFPIVLLKKTPIPDPTLRENISLVNKMISIVKQRFNEKDYNKQYKLENEINLIACELYNLTSAERKLLGIYGN